MARQRPTRLVMGPCIVEIDCIVIREVQYQLEVNRCRNEEVMAGFPRVGYGAMQINWCRNEEVNLHYIYFIYNSRANHEEVVVKGNFGWVWPMWARCPRIDSIVIREVQYQFEVNLCRNEEIIVKGNFGWVWSMWAGRPRVGNEAIHKVQYQFEVNWYRNEEVNVK
ncbi:hypothetical protein DPMN_029936 [Dreissena polymorpha]|uniref:Uncharacterized protein n=1 Tax=Dreissena polymorpha TaxID=45954 RepID=A0A9D4LY48_DREPO|nr:hypothetical protein DPMN_029936 [Dreissena polymorpha]